MFEQGSWTNPTRLQRDGRETACLLFRALFIASPRGRASDGLRASMKSTSPPRTVGQIKKKAKVHTRVDGILGDSVQ